MYKFKKRENDAENKRLAKLAQDCEFIALNLSKFPEIVSSAEYTEDNLTIGITALIHDRIVTVSIVKQGEKVEVFRYYLFGKPKGEEADVYRSGFWEHRIPELKTKAETAAKKKANKQTLLKLKQALQQAQLKEQNHSPL